MDQTLKLNDGTVLSPAHAIQSGNTLWVYIDCCITLTEAFEMLNDQQKTSKITEQYAGASNEYVGYTDLFCIRREENGEVNAGLHKV